ncbi:MAG: DNA-binding response regulator [Gemmatimonadetes bacterium]|nr:DNA-binding response regulator [Gemmatimonadota bacterium]
MTPEEPVVYVVDDDASVREALSSLIRSEGLHVETFASAEGFRAHPRADAPACLVLDVQLPGSSGMDLPGELSASEAPIPIIFITGHGTIPMGVRAMKEGAVEFLTKPFGDAELIGAVRQALQRDRAARGERAELAEVRQRWERLTPRERQVLALVVAGRMNKQIASELGAAEQTIKVHRGRVMRKLEARSVPDLVRLVERIAGQPWAADAPRRAEGRSLAGPDDAGPGPSYPRGRSAGGSSD